MVRHRKNNNTQIQSIQDEQINDGKWARKLIKRKTGEIPLFASRGKPQTPWSDIIKRICPHWMNKARELN